MASEFFHVRKLIWDEMKQHVRPSEVRELRITIGNQLIDQNEVRLIIYISCSRYLYIAD